MRGDLTRTYLLNALLSEEDILRNIFSCEKFPIDSSKYAFDWSNVLMSSNLKQFKKKPNDFCLECPDPELIKKALISYQGIKT